MKKLIMFCLLSIFFLQEPAFSAFNFIDNGNGTVTDGRTGLVWLKNANPYGWADWAYAKAYCSSLASGMAGLTDGSTAGQWRLPTLPELEGLGTDPPTTYCLDFSCFTCPVVWTMPATPFTNVAQSYGYWSSTRYGDRVNMPPLFVGVDGSLNYSDFSGYNTVYIWPVRETVTTTTTSVPPPGWQIETICSECTGGMDIAIDTSDNVHVYYYNEALPSLDYAFKDDLGWHQETIYSDRYGNFGGYDIDVDSFNYPHTVFVTNSAQNLKYAYKNSTGWHIEPIENYSYLNSFTAASLAIDSNDIARVSYIDARAADFNAFEINYAYKNLNQWKIYSLNSHGGWGANTSIAIDSNNEPHICYNYVNTSDNLSYLKYIHDSLYSSETVISGNYLGFEPQIALSPDGQPVIIHWDGHELISYSFKDASGWHTEPIYMGVTIAEGGTLAIDKNGTPHVSFNDITNANIKYAYKNATGWQIESLEDFYSYSRIAVDSKGNPHLLYTTPDHTIKHAWYENPTLVTLSSLKALPKDRNIIIEWFTESETDNAGYNLYRSTSESGEFSKINAALIPAKGSSTQGATYEFTDNNVQNRKTYYYKLEDIDLNGISTMHGPVKATPRWIYEVGR